MKTIFASKTSKSVYCKRCGNEIDNKSRKCSGCEKQYFRFSKLIFIWCVLAMLVVGLLGLNVYQYLLDQKTTVEFNNRIETLIDIREDLLKQREEASLKFGKKEIELIFWNKYAVICTTEGYKYHHYGCGHIEDRTFYIYNISQAESLGYTPCLDCWKG